MVMQNRIDGATFSDKDSWQMGKSAASVRFVNNAEEHISQSNSDIDKALLREAVEKIKIGDLVFVNFKDPALFLEEWWEKFNEYLKGL